MYVCMYVMASFTRVTKRSDLVAAHPVSKHLARRPPALIARVYLLAGSAEGVHLCVSHGYRQQLSPYSTNA